MQIGGTYAATKIGRAEWGALADALRVDGGAREAMLEMLGTFALAVEDGIATVAAAARDEAVLPEDIIAALEDGIAARAGRCARQLGATRSRTG